MNFKTIEVKKNNSNLLVIIDIEGKPIQNLQEDFRADVIHLLENMTENNTIEIVPCLKNYIDLTFLVILSQEIVKTNNLSIIYNNELIY